MTSGKELIPSGVRRAATRGDDVELPSPAAKAATRPKARWSRRQGVVSAFAAFAAVGFVAAYVTPIGAAFAEVEPVTAEATTSYMTAVDDAQSLLTAGEAVTFALERDSYSVYVKPKPKPTPRAASGGGGGGLPPKYTGGGSKTEWLTAAGIKESDWGFVDYIVKRESGWNPNATNKSSGACGLVQALPCSKVPGNGYNPVDNLRWANKYAKGRYGSWEKAYNFWTRNHWW